MNRPDRASLDLSGKRALVTGGSRGIGRATAILLASAGANVGIGYRRDHERAGSVCEAIRAAGVTGWAEPGDLASPEGAEHLFARVDREFGGLDICIANAGIWPSEYVPVSEIDDETWSHVIRVNLDSAFRTAREAARRMAAGGRIVMVSSTAGQRGEAGHAHYAASKGAIQSFVKSLAVELAPRDINVNAVAPGWVDTDMAAPALRSEDEQRRIESEIPLGRLARARDIAGPIVFLCTDLARHITGEVLNVNGGSVLCG